MARQSLSPMKDFDNLNINPAEVAAEVASKKGKNVPMSHLKYLRKKCGYTLETLSEVTSISISYLSRLESGSRRLNTDLIKRLSRAFRCSISELLQETSHDDNLVTSLNFGKKGRGHIANKDAMIPLYKIIQNMEGHLILVICSSNEWKQRPLEFLGRDKVFAVEAEEFFKPHFSSSSTLYLEQSDTFSPESTIVILDHGDVLIKRVWSVTPKIMQFCSLPDLEKLKRGENPEGLLTEVSRDAFDTIYKVVGYSDFCLE